MALDYCEVCGVLLDGSAPAHAVQDAVICETCFASRRTELVSDQGHVPNEPLQFHCCYCQSLLRLKPVTKRTRVRCPTCNDTFYLHADGRVEAKLEGSRTAVLQQEAMSLTPPQGVQLDASKTQPLKRPDFSNVPSSVEQQALLSDLAPKRLDFLDDLPSSQQAPVDTGAFVQADPSSNLELLPEEVGPGQADDFQRSAPLLQEGEVDLEPEALRQRVERQRGRAERQGERRKATARKPKLTPEERKERQRERERKIREREQKVEAAEARGAAKQAEAERKVLASSAWFALWLLPLVFSLGSAALSARGQGFASRGAAGDLFLRTGEAAHTAVESLRDMLQGQ